MILCSDGSEHNDCCLLRYNAVEFGRCVPMFEINTATTPHGVTFWRTSNGICNNLTAQVSEKRGDILSSQVC